MRAHGFLRLGLLFGGLASAAAARTASAAEYYVATTGSDSNAGTMAAPFATLQKGHDVAAAGDTVWIRGGTYAPTTGKSNMSGYTISKSGTSDTNRIKFWAYPGELPVFDFANLQIGTGTSAGIYVTGSWLHFKGFEVKNMPMPGGASNNGIWNVGSSASPAANNIFENLNIHHITGPGLSIAHNGNGVGGGHLILNCDSHDNYDPNSSQGDGQNADGFGHHYQKSGPSSIYRGCRAWWNSDDGYDLISQEVPVIIENCWAMGSGYADSGTRHPPSANGNGFKVGSSQTGVRHIVRNSLAWKNYASGFYANHSTGGNDWYNNTSYMNGTQYNMLASSFDSSGNVTGTITLSGSKAHVMRNNIGFPNRNSNMDGVDTMFNSWDLNITPANGDFVSVSDANVIMGPRKADGSLPDVSFMHLAAGSQMINKGTDVRLPFVGSAPDLGAFEYGAATTTGTGGTSGSAGSGGAGAGGGAAGAGGRGGTGGGAAGRGGAGGMAGAVTGTGGRGGAAGSSASAGSGGNVGSTGAAGNASAGTSGAGTAGTVGTAGAAGAAGTGAGGASAGSGGNTVVTGTGGATATGAAGSAATGTGGSNPTGGVSGTGTGTGGTTPGETDASGGCGCTTGATPGGASSWPLLAVGALGLILRRRRRT